MPAPKKPSSWESFKYSAKHDADDFADDFKSMFLQELSWGSFMHSVEHGADRFANDLCKDTDCKEAGDFVW